MLRIDGDILVFKAGFAAERQRYRVNFRGTFEEFTSSKTMKMYIEDMGLQVGEYEIEKWRELDRVEQALWNVRDLIRNIVDATPYRRPQVLLSGGHNFRYDIFPEYKANRNPSHRPTYEEDIRRYLVEDFGAEVTDGEEADDQLGIRQYTDWALGRECMMATLDKDLNMIPGVHYNWEKGTVYDVSVPDANRWFYKQLLMGDAVDGVKGIPGIGPKSADAILESSPDHYRVVLGAYLEAGLTEDLMHQYASVLWIRRKSGQVWKPGAENE